MSRTEAAVAIAAIFFVLAVLLPVLGHARDYTRRAVCTANQAALVRAWTLYHQEHNGALVGGSTVHTRTPYRWVERPLWNLTDNPETDPYPGDPDFDRGRVTLEHRYNGIRAGRLFPYIEHVQTYHCPADRNWIDEPPAYRAYRTYSISGLMNGEDFWQREAGIYSPIVRYRTVSFAAEAQPKICVEKADQILRPSEKYVFVGENVVHSPVHSSQRYSPGGFVMLSDGNPDAWWDIPNSFHPGGAILGFADGHVGFRGWQDPRTELLLRRQPDPATGQVPHYIQPDNPDLQYVARGYLAGQNHPDFPPDE